MSAVIVVLQSDAGYLLGDAATYHGDGRVAAFRSKVWAASNISAAFTTRGLFNAWSDLRLRMVAATATDADDLFAKLHGVVVSEEATHRKRQPSYPQHNVEVTGVIWRDGAAVGFQISETAFGHYNPVKLGAIYGAPQPEDISELGKPLATVADIEALTMPDDGLALMEMQRRALHETWEGRAHIVGGWCDCATVSAAGVSLETLHTWDDKIGERIQP